MERFGPNRLSLPLVAACLLVLGSCGGSPESASADQLETSTAGSSAASAADVPARPAEFVPYRCSACGCRVFMGDGAVCSRPSCEHPWSDHQRPPQGP